MEVYKVKCLLHFSGEASHGKILVDGNTLIGEI